MAFDVTALVDNQERTFLIEYNDEITVTLRCISREQMNDMLKQATITKFNRSTHQKEHDFDHMLYGDLIGKAAIEDWSGLEVNGQPFPCLPDNITILMRRWADFAKFVADACSDLERLIDAEQELIRKNSGTTSGGVQITPA